MVGAVDESPVEVVVGATLLIVEGVSTGEAEVYDVLYWVVVGGGGGGGAELLV